MKLVVFGLSASSSWGNGHATLWRALIHALGEQGHRVVFFERDQPFYAEHRDCTELCGGELILYSSWNEVQARATRELADADAAMVTSYCPDGIAASVRVLESAVPRRVFYDLDTPVTLEQLRARNRVPYLPPQGLGDFDLVLSFTGGEALQALRDELGARWAAPLYGSVDPAVHFPVPPRQSYAADLSYLGTYAANRQARLERLFIEVARQRPTRRLVIGGAQYPADFPWTSNIAFVRHMPPAEHPAFYCSSPLTLSVTREPMAAMGYCPSGRLFEAAACGVPVLSDDWAGIETFFEPGREVLLARTTEDALAALEQPRDALRRIGRAARARVLAAHTAAHRARELCALLESSGPRTTLDEAQTTGG